MMAEARDLRPPRRGRQDFREEALILKCAGRNLPAIVAIPDGPAQGGLIIVVGGPQYRSGSHRQFTLLARYLASCGIAALRFDHQGLGDGEGEMRNFEAVGPDIRCAVDTFLARVPELQDVTLWGLCDAASALLFYAPTDIRVTSLVLLNPWVHSPRSAATTRLKYYYLKRLMQPSFWTKLLFGGVDLKSSAHGVIDAAAAAGGGQAPWDPRHGSPDYIDRMLAGRTAFQGPVLTLLSENDLVASEFRDLLKVDHRWRKAMACGKCRLETLPAADHTFSDSIQSSKVEVLTAEWMITHMERYY